MRQARTYFGILAVAVMSLAGCSRAVSVGSEPVNYSILVQNQMPHSMNVSWSDGGGAAKALGSVRSGMEERFIIAAPSSTTISVTAQDANRTHTAGPYTVNLSGAGPQRVQIK